MFEWLYRQPKALRRQQEAPWVEERERFLVHLASRGTAQCTLRRYAQKLSHIAQEIDPNASGRIAPEDIGRAVERWVLRCDRPARKSSESLFVSATTHWLRFLGRLRLPEIVPSPFADLIQDFADWMRKERALSPATIRTRSFHVGYFFNWYREQRRSFSEVALKDVDAYLFLQGQQRWSRRTVAASAMVLRAFFRHAEHRQWCKKGIAAAIQGPSVYTGELLPVGPGWEDVQRLISSAAGNRPCDIRARAILLLFSIYGFRSGEVAALCLEDLDWEKELISLRRPKQRRAQQYPLVREVGEAILLYLKEARPRSSHRELFLTIQAPSRPLSPAVLFDIVKKRFRKLSIRTPHCGPHALRHACATHLLAGGLSFKEIGDHLGHRSAHATRVYAKVDLVGLRQVADFHLGGLL
jgi:integrase/recombinase XerD